MLQSMSLKTLFQWQTYFRQRAERTDADMTEERMGGQKSPEQVMSILDRYKGSLNA